MELTGARRELYDELRRIYGVTVVEAVNILNGYNISEYVEKYQRIENIIPVNRKIEKDKKKDELDEG